jgi:transposase
MYRHHSLEKKLEAISLYGRGYGSVTIGRRLGIDDSQIRRWIRMYRISGKSGLHKEKHTQSTADIRREVVDYVLKKCVSCGQAALEYGISESAVHSWLSKFKIGGYEMLSVSRLRGRPPKDMGRPKKKEPQTEREKMEEELRYLRAENAYLKKLKALVEERVARESGKSPEPSKN